MTIVRVTPDPIVQDTAQLLLDDRIGTALVADARSELIGMINEGGLLVHNRADRLPGQTWWLTLLSKAGHADVAVTETVNYAELLIASARH